MSAAPACAECGCTNLDLDQARGCTVCTDCGAVLDDQAIVSEIQFSENSLGGNSMVGQFVPVEGSKMIQFGTGYNQCTGRKSREITLYNGKQKINNLGHQLHLNQHCLDMAFNFYKMAVARGITRGRKNLYVISACIYMVCRTEGTPHMLIDISDIVQAPVFKLGHMYMQLSKGLCISPPALDPCIYIQRYAHKLEFGNRTHDVMVTAMRLLSRMKRDWMAQGRRPSGLCGAALLVASRIHNFNRTIKDIIKVVRIGENTIKKRLIEFEETPSSNLTIDEFQNIDLETEANPPCFNKQGNALPEDVKDFVDNIDLVHLEINQLRGEIEVMLDTADTKRDVKIQNCDTESMQSQHSVISICKSEDGVTLKGVSKVKGKVGDIMLTDEQTIEELSKSLEFNITDINDIDYLERKGEGGVIDSLLMQSPPGGTKSFKDEPSWTSRPTAASLGLTTNIEQCLLTTPKQQDSSESDGELDLEGIDDDEIDQMILKPEEVVNKTKLWLISNIDFLREQKVIKIEKERLIKEELAKDPSQRKKKKVYTKKIKSENANAGMAIEKMLVERKISSKINYDVLRGLIDTKENIIDLKIEAKIEAGVKKEETPSQFSDSVIVVDNSDLKPFSRKRALKKEPLAKPVDKKVKVESIVENGPIEYIGDVDEEDEDDGEDEHVSAATLMGNANEGDHYEYDAYSD